MQNTASSRKPGGRASGARPIRVVAGWLGVLGLVAVSATADDRDLLRLSQSGSADPYVFVIFDTSGSMTLTSACTPADTLNDIDPFDAMCTQECTLDDATCANLCPSEGCREYAIVDPDNPITVLEEIIIDVDTAASAPTEVSFTPSASDWLTNSDFDFYKGSSFVFDDFTGEDGLSGHKTVTYNPTINNAGTYMIYMSWPEEAADLLATNVMVDVTHLDGTDTVTTTVSVDQSQNVETGAGTQFDGWNLIGSFELDTGATMGTVVIRNEAADYNVVADAVRWARIEVPPCLDPTDLIYRCQQPICSQGDCFTPLNADDPNSKFYQAKQALYDAIESVDNVHFGFGSYEQDNARMHAKHWLYRVRQKNPLTGNDQTLPTLDGTPLLEVGDDEVFGNYALAGDLFPGVWEGDGWSCHTNFAISTTFPPYDSTRVDQQIGCNASNPADITDIWETARARRIPKLGYDGSTATVVWYRKDYTFNELYGILYLPDSGSYGDSIISATIEVYHCPGFSCSLDQSVDVYYDLVSDYAAFDGVTLRNPISPGGYFWAQSNANALDGVNDYGADASTCFGLEPNNDSDADVDGDFEADDVDTRDDLWYDYSVKWPTTQDSRGDDLNLDGTPDSPRQDVFDVGDRIPLDWLTSNEDEIKRRLAPNSVSGGNPDFRVAKYFENDVGPLVSSNPGTDENEPDFRRLELLNDESDGDTSDDERPLLANGQTPLGESLADFKVWYAGSEDIAPGDDPDDPKYQGWADVATILDTDFPCRQKFILLLTDGVDTCYQRCQDPDESPPCTSFDNDPCDVPGDLLDQEQVKTYVVGFGISDGSSLDCIAESGGTEEPLLPRNKDELVSALESILADVQAEQRTFASASIPAVQSTAADKIFLSSFTPIPDTGFWPGRIDAFRAPLPLTSDNRPDVDRSCVDVSMASNNLQSACHLWEAGKVLCQQVEDGERTVLYGMEHTEGLQIPGAARPGALRELTVPTYLFSNPTDGYDVSQPDLPLVEDLAGVFLSEAEWDAYVDGTFDNLDIYTLLTDVIDPIIGLKDLPVDFIGQIDACDTDGDDEADAFAMGDIFHASPVAISGPSNFTYFANDQCGPAQRTDIPNNCVSPTDPAIAVDEDRGYRRFAADHVWRRRMLAAPTNDGQLHVFDTGIRQLVDNDFTTDASDKIELFNDGGGKELFSYIPRMVAPVVKEQVEGGRHVYTMDGTVTVADVFIDPGDTIGGSSTTLDRAWRTVLVGGLREAGDFFVSADGVDGFKSGYYALDVTQPDTVVERSDLTDPTLVPCENAGCSETAEPNDEYFPSCLELDAQGIVTETSDCPYRIDPAPTDTPQFPAELWTFTDSWLIEDPDNAGEYLEFYLDEDASTENGYGIPDLADTWSRPVITQIAVCTGSTDCVFGAVGASPNGDELETKHVAIFGGGMDPTSKDLGDPSNLSGAYLYMVDIETGFPIYKKKLCPARDSMTGACTTDAEGGAPSDPTVLDIDRDGIADVVYIGTTDGFLYKVQLKTASGVVPSLVGLGDTGFDITNSQLIRDPDGDGTYTTWADTPTPALSPTASAETTLCGTVDPCAPRIVDSVWDPYPILDTDGSPIYFSSSAFLVPELNQFALTVGTGDREDLWSTPTEGGVEGKFFVFVDEDFQQSELNTVGACVDQLPITESCLVSFSFTAEPIPSDINLLTAPPDEDSDLEDDDGNQPTGVNPISEQMRRGWVMSFPTSDPLQNRVTSEAFAVSGILVFSVFDPNTVAVSSGDDDDDDDAGDDDDDDDTRECGRSGTTRAFVVLAGNGSPLVNLSALGDTDKDTGDDDDDSGGGSGDDDDELTARDRYQEIAEFTTAPQIVRRQTPNKPGAADKTIQDVIDDQLQSSFRQAVLDHLPRGSRFNEAFEMVIVALRNSTGVNVYASIPIAMYPADWADQ